MLISFKALFIDKLLRPSSFRNQSTYIINVYTKGS